MADYIYLLENRLIPAQQTAIQAVRDVIRGKGITLFLVGGAVRDLTSGSSVRDLDITVQGNALKLKKDIEGVGGLFVGENDSAQALYFLFPGGVRMEISSALSVEYPKPGKAVYTPANILDDLRRRDFTANAMGLSLNEGSYGLLMDPLNGVADIENRELRLVSNYGFIEDPSRLIRAARLVARSGWTMEERTRGRYDMAKDEDYIRALTEWQRGYELEEIVYEEDSLRVLRALETEGWLSHLSTTWNASKANVTALTELAEVSGQLVMQGIRTDASAIAFPLLTSKMPPKDVDALKASFARQGFVLQIDAVEQEAKNLSTQLTAKSAALPSESWKLLHAAKPESVLSLAFTAKGAAIQNKFKSFFTEWPTAKQRIPYVQMQEMRITPDLPRYDELLDNLFFALMDGKLTTPEEIKAFLEPYSPPAPPPTVHLRRPRAAKKDAKPKGRGKKAAASLEPPPTSDGDDDPISASATSPEPDGLKTTAQLAEMLGAEAVPPVRSAGKSHASGEPASSKKDSAAPKKHHQVAVPSKSAAAHSKVVAVAAATGKGKPPVKSAAVKHTATKAAVVAKKTPVKAAPPKKAAAVPASKKSVAPAKKAVKKVAAPAKKAPAKKAAATAHKAVKKAAKKRR